MIMTETLTHVETQLLEWPADLRELVGERELIELVFAEAQVVGEQMTASSEPVTRTRSRMLLSLLTYCYASGISASEDVEWACAHDSGARYVCANATPPRDVIRQFRRVNRSWIEQSLTRVLDAIVVAQPVSHGDVASMVRRRIDLAIMMDTALCD